MNPFRYGGVVSRNNYCARPVLETQLVEKCSSGQNVWVSGERRTGKTSLILHAVNSMKGKKALYIDLLEVKSVEDVHKRFLNAIIRYEAKAQFLQNTIKKMASLRPVMTFDAMTGLPSISVDSSIEFKPDSLEGLLDLLRDTTFSRTIVVMDEFQDILNLKDSVQTLAVMRSTIQFLDKTPFVFCGSISNKMDKIFNDPQSPFFKSALIIYVGPIDHITFRDFITKRFTMAKYAVVPTAIDKIFQTAGENPGDIQQLCSALYDITEKNSKIDDVVIDEALKYIFSQEQKGYEACLTQVSAIQLKCLTTLARLGGRHVTSKEFIAASGIRQPSTIKKSLLRLQDIKVLYSSEGEYRFVNPYFGRWLVQRNY